MTTIARHIISDPVRTASETWKIIVDLLAPDSNSSARSELLSASGIASSLIASEALKDSPIIVYGSGPRIRIYCLYGEDAIMGDDANESVLSSNPTAGDWVMSLPCPEDDLEWVQNALSKRSQRITVRDMNTPVENEETNTNGKSANIDMEAFLRR